MNRKDAKILAEKVTNFDLYKMFRNAMNLIPNWEVSSIVNSSMSKGASWSVLAEKFDVKEKYHPIAKQNMIREFGEYLSEDIKQLVAKPKKVKSTPLFHREPDFKNFKN